ncbi:MAG: alpha/beta fold hydrolase [Bacteroidetes bacterium]|nr:alpha/beta fold hydrolase [Bacteroidota bacterium]
MPHITSSYIAQGLFKNGHFSTIYSAKLRQGPKLLQERERIILADDDFIDLDWSYSPSPTRKVAILLHGLEGNAQRIYMRGHARKLIENGWDVCAINYRGCSGEDNMSYTSYNAGKTDDLQTVISTILHKDFYTDISLVGFSLGGNLLLKYLGEQPVLPKQISKGIAISAPLNLKGSLSRLEESQNWIYRTSFLYNLKKKYKIKMEKHPEYMNMGILKNIKSLKDFDDIYTAPAHGFNDAYDYYDKNSSLQFLPNIRVPILILNALNDTFLSPECYPFTLSEKRKNIYLETPKHGGHVGFHQTSETYYSESRTVQFLNTN